MRLLRAVAALLVATPFVVAALLAGCTRSTPGEARIADAPAESMHISLEEGKHLAAERRVPVLVEFWSPT